MKIERNFDEDFKYSLHDARMQKIEYSDGNLLLYFDYIFSYAEDRSENAHKAKIIFEKVDIDVLDFLIFNDTTNTITKDFAGYCIDLEEYQNSYPNSEFEIIVETYNWGRAVFQGWLWTDEKPVSCIMNIFYLGKMIYEIEG